MIKHNCIKCRMQYDSDDVEAYYCVSCLEQKKAIAKEIDAKLASRPRENKPGLFQQYEEVRKARGSKFVNVRDLGISL